MTTYAPRIVSCEFCGEDGDANDPDDMITGRNDLVADDTITVHVRCNS